MKPRPPLHLMLASESGIGKDTFAATWPKPILVLHLDGMQQDMPYWEKQAQHTQEPQVGDLTSYSYGNCEISYRDIIHQDGVVRVEYYSSDNPKAPNSASVLETRIANLYREISLQGWKTLVCGTLSSAALESRLMEQFILNPNYKDPRKWYGAATEFVERLIMFQKALPINVIFTCHYGRDKDEVAGELVYSIDLPGRLSYGAMRYFGETYRLYISKDEAGNRHRVLQTDHDGRYVAKTHIKAPNPCYPHYESLWENWDKQ